METIGKCPHCGKGDLVRGTSGWTCNYFKAINDNCRFTIYDEYFGHKLSREEIEQLITQGETGVFDMKSEKGKFRAKLKYVEGYIKPIFENSEHSTLKENCPICKGNVVITKNAFICENYFNESCTLYIPKIVAGVEITNDMAEIILSGEHTEWIEDFHSTKGKQFSGRLTLDEDNKVDIDTSVCKCPKCSDGNIFQGEKAYNCSNWKSEDNKCDFTIWRKIANRNISAGEVEDLCLKGETDILEGFKDNKNKNYNKKLILTEDYQVKLI